MTIDVGHLRSGAYREELEMITGFIVHEGDSPRGGHYISYVRQGSDWYQCNDATVSEKPLPPKEAHAAVRQAYVLFLTPFETEELDTLEAL
jgi:ubiquitin C-terminal hydrolase